MEMHDNISLAPVHEWQIWKEKISTHEVVITQKLISKLDVKSFLLAFLKKKKILYWPETNDDEFAGDD